jgi:hypothetical protein
MQRRFDMLVEQVPNQPYLVAPGGSDIRYHTDRELERRMSNPKLYRKPIFAGVAVQKSASWCGVLVCELLNRHTSKRGFHNRQILR